MLPVQYFAGLRERGVDAHLLCHGKAAGDLRAEFQSDADRLHFVHDNAATRGIYAVESRVPMSGLLKYQTFHAARRTIARRQMAGLARRLVRDLNVGIVHEVTPVSPREPSAMFGFGADVRTVVGPLNGGMTFPPAHCHFEGPASRLMRRYGRLVSPAAHLLTRGKRLADLVLVANERTRLALPAGVPKPPGRVVELVENAVHADLWDDGGPPAAHRRPTDESCRFVYLGRFEDWKAVDILLDAFARVENPGVTLDLIGDGPERSRLEARAAREDLDGRVRFHGYVSQPQAAGILRQSDVFVLPSLAEAGGAVVLEAMACGLAVIISDWGGPLDYVDDASAIRVFPHERPRYVADLATAMTALARDPLRRRAMAAAAQRRIRTGGFTWPAKIDRIMELYAASLDERRVARG
jgi:glycosyltransferase involved in cell wall biosynthesis